MKPGHEIDPPLIETWKAMELCVKEVRHAVPARLHADLKSWSEQDGTGLSFSI